MSSEKILGAAADPKYRGIPYALPPDPAGRSSIDCSLYVLMVFRDAGQPFPPGVRTAEQIRQASMPIDDDDVQPGDLLFFKNTYPTAGASHIGISLGRGSHRMYDAHERSTDPYTAVGVSDLNSYWQQHWMEARRYDRAVVPTPGPPPAPGTIRMRVDAWGLNVRELPAATSKILTTLPHGTTVQAGPYAWRPVTVNGVTGWVADEYLEEV